MHSRILEKRKYCLFLSDIDLSIKILAICINVKVYMNIAILCVKSNLMSFIKEFNFVVDNILFLQLSVLFIEIQLSYAKNDFNSG